MKKLLAFVLVGGFAFGCASNNQSIPGAAIPFAEANYEMSGDTSAEECANQIVGIYWGYLFSSKTGTIRGGKAGPLPIPSFGPAFSGPSAVAVRKALDKLPKATHALDTRRTITKAGIPFLFTNTCSKVRTRGVTMKGPLPN